MFLGQIFAKKRKKMTLKHFCKRWNRSRNKIRKITVKSRNEVKSACFWHILRHISSIFEDIDFNVDFVVAVVVGCLVVLLLLAAATSELTAVPCSLRASSIWHLLWATRRLPDESTRPADDVVGRLWRHLTLHWSTAGWTYARCRAPSAMAPCVRSECWTVVQVLPLPSAPLGEGADTDLYRSEGTLDETGLPLHSGDFSDLAWINWKKGFVDLLLLLGLEWCEIVRILLSWDSCFTVWLKSSTANRGKRMLALLRWSTINLHLMLKSKLKVDYWLTVFVQSKERRFTASNVLC